MYRAAALALALAAGPALADTAFILPSGNIGCMAFDDGGGQTLHCDILEIDGQRPPRPASCDLDWGYRYVLGESGAGGMGCAGDTVIDRGAQVLNYGASVRAGAITCSATTAGLDCRNGQGHGIFLSRASQRAF